MPDKNGKLRDLGLTYIEAAHGIQSATLYRLTQLGVLDETKLKEFSLKHLRTGIDLSKAEQGGLAGLLISKGVFTTEEYLEFMRLAANDELVGDEEQLGGLTFR